MSWECYGISITTSNSADFVYKGKLYCNGFSILFLQSLLKSLHICYTLLNNNLDNNNTVCTVLEASETDWDMCNGNGDLVPMHHASSQHSQSQDGSSPLSNIAFLSSTFSKLSGEERSWKRICPKSTPQLPLVLSRWLPNRYYVSRFPHTPLIAPISRYGTRWPVLTWHM